MTDTGPVRKGGYRIAAWRRVIGAARRSGQDDEVVAVDDLVGQPVASSEVWRPGDPLRAPPRSTGPGPSRTARRCRRRSRPRRRRRRSPRRRARRPAAASGGRRHRARRAPSSTTTRPGARRGRTRSTACGSRAARPRARTTVPTGRPAMASADDVGRVGGGDHRPHARPRGDLRRRELGGHAAAPPCGARCRRRAPRARRRPRRSPR